MDARCDLIQIFREAQALLAAPDNDFRRAGGWACQADALTEVGGIIETLRAGGAPEVARMRRLFRPMACLEAIALASGWPDQFMILAERFEETAGQFERQPRLRVVAGDRR